MWWLWIVGIVVALACLKIWCIGGVNRYQPDLTGKVAVVVGGTAGIGKETARDLAKLGATVIITGRDVAKAAIVLESINSEMQVHVQAKVKPVEFVKSDCADLSQIKEFADQLARRYEAVDILVNNAGLTCSELTRTKQGIETTVGVNYISLVYLTSLLLPQLRKAKDARIVNVSSRGYKDYLMLHDKSEYYNDFLLDEMTPERFKRFKAYTRSKLGQVYFAQNLARLFEANGITNIKTASLHPGVVRSEIWNRNLIPAFIEKIKIIFVPILWLLFKSEKEGAQTSLHISCCPSEALKNGAYYCDCQVEALKKIGTDGKLMQISWNEASNKIKQLTGHAMFEDLILPPHLDGSD